MRKSENVAINADRLLGIGGEDGEMIHPTDQHLRSPPARHCTFDQAQSAKSDAIRPNR